MTHNACVVLQPDSERRYYTPGTIPNDWARANITPIFKKGNHSSAENYRPVSLTCVCSKILEHVICKHILNNLEQHHALTPLQHGFSSVHSCYASLSSSWPLTTCSRPGIRVSRLTSVSWTSPRRSWSTSTTCHETSHHRCDSSWTIIPVATVPMHIRYQPAGGLGTDTVGGLGTSGYWVETQSLMALGTNPTT